MRIRDRRRPLCGGRLGARRQTCALKFYDAAMPMTNNRLLAIDCGATHVAAGLFVGGKNKRWRLEKYAREDFVLHNQDDAHWQAAVHDALGKMMRRETWGASKCCLSIPGHFALTKVVKTPAVAREKRSRVAQFETTQNIPYPLGEIAWDFLEIADHGSELDMLIAAVRLDVIEALCATFEANGLTVVRCEPVGVALWQTLRRRVATATLLVDVGAISTQVILAGGHGAHLRTLAMGGDSLTATVAERLAVDLSAGEQLKRSIGKVASDGPTGIEEHAVLQAAVSDFETRLQVEIQRTRLAFLRQSGVNAPEQVHLIGRGVTPGLSLRLQKELGLPVAPLLEDGLIEVAAHETVANTSELAVLAGLVVGAAGLTASVNLLPPARREAQVRRQRLPWWWAAAGLIVLLPTPLLFQQRAIAQHQQEELARLQAQLQPLRQLVRANDEKVERLRILDTRLAALADIGARREGWVSLLASLQECFSAVGDCWLDSLDIAVNEAEAEEAVAFIELSLSGRFLDPGDADAKVRGLFDKLQALPIVAGLSGERFDRTKPGLLGYTVTLHIKSEAKL